MPYILAIVITAIKKWNNHRSRSNPACTNPLLIDSKSWNMISEVMCPLKTPKLCIAKIEAVTCLKAEGKFCVVFGKRLLMTS